MVHVDVLKFQTVLDSLIRVFPVCYSEKQFVNFSIDNTHIIWEQKESVQNFRSLPYFFFTEWRDFINDHTGLDASKPVFWCEQQRCRPAFYRLVSHLSTQSELPRPITQNSVEWDHRCTLKNFFNNGGDSLTLTLYNVTLMSQKPC